MAESSKSSDQPESNVAKATVSRSRRLDELPYEIVERIFSKLDWATLRATCSLNRRICAYHGEYILYTFKRHLRFPLRQQMEASDIAMQEMMRTSFDLFLGGEFDALLGKSLVPLFAKMEGHGYTPPISIWRCFVRHFHENLLREIPYKRNAQQVHVYYVLSFLNILKKFRTYKLIHCKRALVHWRIEIELGGVFLGSLPIGRRSKLPHHPLIRNDLLAILCELLYLSLLKQKTSLLLECTYPAFVYGHEWPLRRRSSRLRLQFTMHGPMPLVEFIANHVMNNGVNQPTIPVTSEWPTKPRLTINMDLICKQAHDVGFCELKGIDILSSLETIHANG